MQMTQYVISLCNRFDECIYCKKGYNPRITLSATTLRDYISYSRGADKFVREGGWNVLKCVYAYSNIIR